MSRKRKRKKKPKLVRVLTRFFKSDLGPAWIGLAVVMLGALLLAIHLNAMFLFWAFAVGVLVVIVSVVLVVKVARPAVRASSGNDADYDPGIGPEPSWESFRTEHDYSKPAYEPPTYYGPTTNLPNHFN